jgi:hypothetical protein
VTKLTASAAPVVGETLLELAVRQDSDPWILSALNNLGGTWDALPGDALYSPNGTDNLTANGLPSAFISAEVKSLPLKQGGTAEIIVQPANGITLSGFLVDHSLHFFDMGDGRQVALQGVHAMLDPGVYPLHLDATLPDGTIQSYEQMVLVASGDYPLYSLTVNDVTTLDPAIMEPENQKILAIVTPVTPQRYWQEPFRLPVDKQFGITAWYGDRRTYNGGAYNSFHSGVDYGVYSTEKPFDIYAPAPGVVVFSEKLTVRGNATIIDHGQGIYSGFWHQEEVYVSVGDLVTAVRSAYDAAMREMPTKELTRALEQAVVAHQPPLVRGRRIKLRYAHQGGRNPPVVVIHGNQTQHVPAAYRRYLENYFREVFKLRGTPMRIEFRTDENPFAGRRNELTQRQVRKRQRLIRRVKGGKR